MHSSTPACCPYLPACTAMGVYLPGGVPAWGVYLPRGLYLPREVGVYLPGGVPAQEGVPAQGGVTAQRECTCPGGVPAWGCTCPGTSPLWTEFLTHATENITLPQTLFVGGKNRNVHVLLQHKLPWQNRNFTYYRPQTKFAKVIFLHVSVILSTVGESPGP